jgi:Rps23 Pro-64 3,4-dihydroxylase Tpa1-like proline 4-hydroxylase
MRHKKITTSSGRFIDIYDDVFPPHLQSHHIGFVQRSRYKLGASSNDGVQWQKDKTFFQSLFTEEDFSNFRFINDELLQKLQNYEVNGCWVLVSSPLSTYYYHTDGSDPGITLLYYVNTRWDRDWGGETLFANDEGECEIAVEYKPNRIVIFDSLIEHKSSSISMQADEFRFVFVIQMKPKINCAT